MKRLIAISAVMMMLSACPGGGGGGSVSNSGGGNSVAGYTVDYAVSGLSGTVVLQNNGSDILTVGTNGSFTFPASLADGTAYSVTVKTQPLSQTCSVVNGTGIISGANVTNVTVTCSTFTYTLGGIISNLSGAVVLHNNDTDFVTVGTNGSFTFPASLADGTAYGVTVKTQPASQTCSVVHGKGIISAANVTNVTVTCSKYTYTVGGIISTLSGTVVLQNNDTDVLTVGTNGSFTFPTSLADGTTYDVTVITEPASQSCAVVNGTGTLSGANVNGVNITCQAAIAWDAPVSITDGSPLTDVAGYKLYYGTNPGIYSANIDVGNTTRYLMTDFSAAVLVKGTYYITVTAYDGTKTIESTYSNEITIVVN